MIKLESKELKKFISKYIREAVTAGFKPSSLNFYEIQQDFDYDLFSRNVHIMRNGKYGEILYHLLLLSCIFLNKGISYRNPNKKSFFDWTLEYVKASDLILNKKLSICAKSYLTILVTDILRFSGEFTH